MTDDVLYAVEAQMRDGRWVRQPVIHFSREWAEEDTRTHLQLKRAVRVVAYRRAEVVEEK